MLAILEELPPEPTFLRNEFFRNTVQSDTDSIDIDIVKGRRRVVPYVRPVQEGVIIERDGFFTNTYKVPYIKIKRASEADRYIHRAAGETPYTAGGPAAQAARELVRDFADLKGDIALEEERQAAEAVYTGKVTIRGENGAAFQNIDFGLPATHNETLTGTNKWSDDSQEKNEILAFLRAKRRLLVTDSGISPTDIVVATDVSDVIISKFDPNNETSGLSSIRVDRGQIDIRNLPNGVTYLGFFKELGVDFWAYDGTYTDLDGTVKPYAPAGKIAMLSRNARFDRNYGAIKNYHGNFAAVPIFPLSWIENDGRARFVQIESAPLYAPHQVDALYVAQVL
jgi:hypothetical protein